MEHEEAVLRDIANDVVNDVLAESLYEPCKEAITASFESAMVQLSQAYEQSTVASCLQLIVKQHCHTTARRHAKDELHGAILRSTIEELVQEMALTSLMEDMQHSLLELVVLEMVQEVAAEEWDAAQPRNRFRLLPVTFKYAQVKPHPCLGVLPPSTRPRLVQTGGVLTVSNGATAS